MDVQQISELRPGTPVWIWIVRVGKGQWWPGSVSSIAHLESFLIVDTRFEYHSDGRNGTVGPARIGISTTRTRYLELRDTDLKGLDRPDFVPSANFAESKKGESGCENTENQGALGADAQVAKSSAVVVK